MLVLTRKVGEQIVIGEEIRVTVLAVSGNRVQLGIAAPKSVAVHREEVHRRVQQKVIAAGGQDACARKHALARTGELVSKP